jgi:ArsR family transcriptional regulator, nickel/cobalt-responsive transcriptional repressor
MSIERLTGRPLARDRVSMERSSVSHQLRLPRHLGVVTSERRRQRIIYVLHDLHLGGLLRQPA